MRVAVLISGSGTTLRNLIQHQAAGKVDLDFRLVISSDPQAAGLGFASDADIPSQVIQSCDYDSPEAFGAAIFAAVREVEAEYVLMGGFLKLVPIPDDFQNRVLNIHPALIPAFCGHGFYGRRVHEAVLEYGAKVSGCTVHFVDNQYDHGPIILQKVVPVLDDDTPATLAMRVFDAECEAYPEALRLLAAGRLHVEGRRVRSG
ncbi:MAG: phosphoribosylglycinamide formyltransferase [Planctomycetales bacterium]|nr:phosphoribosylglycinamide formyltransferase [Planctomycetales bacterium]